VTRPLRRGGGEGKGRATKKKLLFSTLFLIDNNTYFTILLNYVSVLRIFLLSKFVFGYFKAEKKKRKKVPMAIKLEGGRG